MKLPLNNKTKLFARCAAVEISIATLFARCAAVEISIAILFARCAAVEISIMTFAINVNTYKEKYLFIRISYDKSALLFISSTKLLLAIVEFDSFTVHFHVALGGGVP